MTAKDLLEATMADDDRGMTQQLYAASTLALTGAMERLADALDPKPTARTATSSLELQDQVMAKLKEVEGFKSFQLVSCRGDGRDIEWSIKFKTETPEP